MAPSARISRTRSSRGNGVLIAAHAKSFRLMVVTNNENGLRYVGGLKFENRVPGATTPEPAPGRLVGRMNSTSRISHRIRMRHACHQGGSRLGPNRVTRKAIVPCSLRLTSGPLDRDLIPVQLLLAEKLDQHSLAHDLRGNTEDERRRPVGALDRMSRPPPAPMWMPDPPHSR
jgi:hypothetical protein